MPDLAMTDTDWTRRGLLAGGLSCLAAGSLAAADRPLHLAAAEAASRHAPPGTRLGLLLPAGCRENVDPVTAEFSRLTGIAVKMTEVPVDDINTRLMLDTMSDSGAHDIALPATFGIPDLAAAGAILPITDYARRHEPPGFRDGVLYPTGDSFDGELYGFQTDGDAYVMFYNNRLLKDPDEQARYADRHGQALEIPLTWEDLDRQMAFFNRPDDGLYGGLLFRTPGYVAWEWWVRFHAKAVWPLSPTLEPQIDSDEGVAALEEMIRSGEHLHPAVRELGLFGNWDRYGLGDIYANIGWGGSQKALTGPGGPMRAGLVHGPTPGGMVRGELLLTPYFNWGWNYVVSARSAQPEAAYLFALFASSPEMSTQAVRQRGGYFDPFREEHYTDAVVRETYSDAFLKVHRKSLRNAIPDLYLARQGEYFAALGTWIDRALRREVAPRAALEQAANHWRLITAQTGRDRQVQRWRALRAKYPVRVRASLRDIHA